MYITELRSIVFSPAYALTVVAAGLAAFLPGGYRTSLVHFMQVQFGQDYKSAWLYSGSVRLVAHLDCLLLVYFTSY